MTPPMARPDGDPDFCRRLNPHLTITDRPFPAAADSNPALDSGVVGRSLAQLDESGFLVTPAVVPEPVMAPMRWITHSIGGP